MNILPIMVGGAVGLAVQLVVGTISEDWTFPARLAAFCVGVAVSVGIVVGIAFTVGWFE